MSRYWIIKYQTCVGVSISRNWKPPGVMKGSELSCCLHTHKQHHQTKTGQNVKKYTQKTTFVNLKCPYQETKDEKLHDVEVTGDGWES